MHHQLNPSLIPTQRLVSLAVLLLGLSGCDSGGSGSFSLPVNQAPVASNSCAYASGVNQPFNGTLSATPAGQSLTYSIVGIASKGSAQVTNPLTGEFTYTPNTNTRGTDTFTFRACEAAPSTVCSNVATYKIVHTPRVMPLGDSITEGVSNGETGGCTGASPCPTLSERTSYRKNLRDALVAAGYTVDFVGTQVSGTALFSEDPQHEGHGGWTANQLVNGHSNPSSGTGTANTGFLLNWLNGKKDTATAPDPANAGWPDVILLHIGTNDLGPTGDQSNLWTDVQSIRDVIATWGASNWPVTVIYSRIVNSNPAVVEFTNFNNNVINNLNPTIWVDHEAALNMSGFYGDGVHPNSSGYSTMANVWLYPLAGMGTVSGNHSGPGILPKCP